MASFFKVTTKHTVPVADALVDSSAQAILTHSTPQTVNPLFPILFSDQVTVQSGGENSFRSENFKNNTGRPIELHGMRAQIDIVTPTPMRVMSGAFIALEITINGTKVTRGSVPVWSMCRSDARRDEFLNLYFGGTQASSYCWYFSQPVPVPAGKGIDVQVKHLGGVPINATVLVSFVGRVSPQAIPRRIPFVAAWTSQSFGYAAVGSDSAPPGILVNDTGRDLNVDRIIGRSVAYDDASLGAGSLELLDFDDVSLQGVNAMLVRLGLSQSRPILKTYTPWRTVFGQNAALETDFIMRAGDYLTADVAHVAGPVLLAPFTFSQNWGVVSIVGWREV